MFINPKRILEEGILTLPKTIKEGAVLQPNGIDLSITSVSRILEYSDCFVGDDVKTQHHLKSGKDITECYHRLEQKDVNGYRLKKGEVYNVETGYELHLPEDMVAFIFTRSSLNRNGILVGSGLWDSGYHGPVGATIYPFRDLTLIPPCRVAQIAFMKAESALLYNGSYNDAAMKKF